MEVDLGDFMQMVHEKPKKRFSMSKSGNEHSRRSLSNPVKPLVVDCAVTPDEIRKLFFSSSTSIAYQDKAGSHQSTSFSDFHKAAHRAPSGCREKAPFWSRDMTRYQEAFIDLPLDGSRVNRELARTFNPNDGGARVTSSSAKIKRNIRTQYSDDFAPLTDTDATHRVPSMKPTSDTHVREDAKLLYTDSVTHEAFKSPQARFRGRPHAFNPSDNMAVAEELPFMGKSRYREEFVNKEGYKVELGKGRDDSNRINGCSIPNRIRDYMFSHSLGGAKSVDVDSVLRSSVSRKPIDANSVLYSNPYLSDYLKP